MSHTPTEPTAEGILAVQLKHQGWLMQLPGVVGIGTGQHQGKPCLLLLVTHATAALTEQLPSTLDGYEVRVQETGGPVVIQGTR
ncbi:MAG: hypothetical protein KGZ35_02405 [Truepera sp.]|nr:hypothetical protein [Truepera sp.]